MIIANGIVEYVTCKICKSSDTLLGKENRLYFITCESCGSSELFKVPRRTFEADIQDDRFLQSRPVTKPKSESESRRLRRFRRGGDEKLRYCNGSSRCADSLRHLASPLCINMHFVFTTRSDPLMR